MPVLDAREQAEHRIALDACLAFEVLRRASRDGTADDVEARRFIHLPHAGHRRGLARARRADQYVNDPAGYRDPGECVGLIRSQQTPFRVPSAGDPFNDLQLDGRGVACAGALKQTVFGGKECLGGEHDPPNLTEPRRAVRAAEQQRTGRELGWG